MLFSDLLDIINLKLKESRCIQVFTDIRIAFKKLSRNINFSYLKVAENLFQYTNGKHNNAEGEAIASDWQKVGDDLRKGIISYGRSKARQ